MPADIHSPDVLELPVESIVDPDHVAADRPAVRGALDRAAGSAYELREAFLAENERRDVARNGRPMHIDLVTSSVERSPIIRRPVGMGAFQFVVLSKLRVAQLMRGCKPRVDGMHKPTITAQLEVSEGKVTEAWTDPSRTGLLGVAPIE